MKRALWGLILILCLSFVFALPAAADNLYGSIRGTVVDASGAVVSGVKLTATNTATGVTYNAATNSSGIFNFIQLPVGDYNVRAEQTGFKSFQASGIHIDLNQIYNLDVKLAIGAVSEQLIVEANPVQVQQTDMQLGTTVEGQQVVDLPLNGRNWTQLQQLEPGIVGTTDRFGGNAGGYSGNGAETQQNSFLVNGLDSNDPTLNTALLVPSPDAISEFRMITSTINPEYGRNSGTIINANIKSGTNQFHGDVFEFYRDTFLDAASYFDKPCFNAVTGAPRSDCRTPFHQNQYGGTIGGPILKDKAFFFFSYQGFHERIPQDPAYTVPTYTTGQYTGGDFSAAYASAPFTGESAVPLIGNSSSTVCPNTTCPAHTPYTALFPGGIVPTGDFNALSVKLVNQFVPVNATGSTSVSPIFTETQSQYLGRIDYKLTNNDALWFYGLYQHQPSTQTLGFTGSNLPGQPEEDDRHTQQYSFSWTHTLSPTSLNELRVGYTRFNFAAVEPLDPINPTTYGFTGITPQPGATASLPIMTVSGLFTLGFSSNGPQPRIQNNYQVMDNFSKVIGHHTLKAGFNLDKISVLSPFSNNLGGNFAFNGAGTFSTGVPGLDFLLGIPSGYTQGSGAVQDAKAHEIYAYFQDQWQVRPSVVLTFGTGYDIETPWLNHYAEGLVMGAWRPGQQSTVFPTAPPGFVYPGDKGINKYGGMTVKYDLFAPRFGFAWSPDAAHNWSVHGGIGLYYNRSESELALQTLTEAPVALTTPGASACAPSNAGFANPFLLADGTPCVISATHTITNPFPFTPPKPGATNIDFSQYAPIGFANWNAEDPRFTAPRSTNFNLTIERQLDKATILSVGYVGNRGRHEEGAYDVNLAGTFPGVNPIAATFPGCFSGLVGIAAGSGCPQTVATENPNLTWTLGPQQPGATPYNLNLYGQPGIQATEYNSKYDSLQVELNRRFSKGLQVLGAYTWSRYFDETSNLENGAFNFPGVNPFNPGDMWAPSQNDAPQRFVVSWTYTLPIYHFIHSARALTDGWNLVGIYTLQHGTPVPVFDLLQPSLTCSLNDSYYACPDRADRVPGVGLDIQNPRHDPLGSADIHAHGAPYFNPAAFTIPTTSGSGYGDASRNPVYGPGLNYADMALEKDFHFSKLGEQRYLELRLETYGTFNHANFANPAPPPGSFTSSEDASGILGPIGRIYTTKTISTNGEGRAVQLAAKFYF